LRSQHRHIEIYSLIWQVPHFQQWLCWEVAEVLMYVFFVHNNIFLIACFVKSSLEVTFWVAFV
jgi:hypothetical protein